MRDGRSCVVAFSIAAVLALGSVAVQTGPAFAQEAPAWTPIFTGSSLAGWKGAGSAPGFSVREGALVCGGPGSSLTFAGGDGRAAYDAFEFSAEVNTAPGADGLVSFHVPVAPPSGHESGGFDILIRHGAVAHARSAPYARTGSLLGVRHVFKSVVADGQWFTLTVSVQKPRVQIRIGDALVVDYVEPGAWPAGSPAVPALGRGTFALQCGGVAGGVRYRNLRVRTLPRQASGTPPAVPVVDAAYLQILELTRAGFPVIDLHAHLKGDLTMAQVLDLSRRTGMFLGLAVNCGKGFPVQDDVGALAALEAMRGQPVFMAMQAEGREWVQLFSKDARARFDYVFTDGMTWTNPAGRRLRLWMPDEVEIGPDEQVFMDLLVSKIVGIIETEPIDIYVNPTFLPVVIRERYDALWTESRMKQVIDAAVRHDVAIEINARYKIPSERFLRLAKASGARFTFGTNNAGATDLGDWSYPLEIQKKLGLTPQDMFVPGLKPSRAQRER